MHPRAMELFRSTVSLEDDTQPNMLTGTTICNLEGFGFLGGKHKQSSRGLYGTIEMQDGWGDKVMSHSTLIQWGMDLQQQFQAAKEGRSFE